MYRFNNWMHQVWMPFSEKLLTPSVKKKLTIKILVRFDMNHENKNRNKLSGIAIEMGKTVASNWALDSAVCRLPFRSNQRLQSPTEDRGQRCGQRTIVNLDQWGYISCIRIHTCNKSTNELYMLFGYWLFINVLFAPKYVLIFMAYVDNAIRRVWIQVISQ